VWLAITLLASVLLGAAGGTLVWLGGTAAPTAVVSGAGMVGGTELLLLAMIGFLRGRSSG
jgi:hypothetical protein